MCFCSLQHLLSVSSGIISWNLLNFLPKMSVTKLLVLIDGNTSVIMTGLTLSQQHQ